MSNLYLRELDSPTHLQQFDANCGKIRYVSDPLAKLRNILAMSWYISQKKQVCYS